MLGVVHCVHVQAKKKNFVQSLAAYSIISYVLQIKDRHNGTLHTDARRHACLDAALLP